MNNSTNNFQEITQMSGNHPKKKKFRPLVVLLVVLVIILLMSLLQVVTTSNLKNKNKTTTTNSTTTIKSYLENPTNRERLNQLVAEVKASGRYSDVKWSTPGDNSLVYEFYTVSGFLVDSIDWDTKFDSVKPQFQELINDNVSKGIADFSITVKYLESDGSLITERTFTKDN